MEYTKGEWTIFDFKDTLDLFEHGHFQIVGNNQRSNVAIIPAHWNNAEANGHLISACPDMYKALRVWDKLRVMQPLDSGADIDAILQECAKITDKALAKADGK